LEHGLGIEDMVRGSLLYVFLFLSSFHCLFCGLWPTKNSVSIGFNHWPQQVEYPYEPDVLQPRLKQPMQGRNSQGIGVTKR